MILKQMMNKIINKPISKKSDNSSNIYIVLGELFYKYIYVNCLVLKYLKYEYITNRRW